jgi:hypothetical protein
MSEEYAKTVGAQWMLERMQARAVNVLQGRAEIVTVAALLLAETTAIGDGAPGVDDAGSDEESPPAWDVRVFCKVDRADAHRTMQTVVPVTFGPFATVNDYSDIQSEAEGELNDTIRLTPEVLDRVEALVARYARVGPVLLGFDPLQHFLPVGDAPAARTVLDRLMQLVTRHNCTILVTQVPGKSWIHRRVREIASVAFIVERHVEPTELRVTCESTGEAVVVRL